MMEKVFFVYKQPYDSSKYGTESLWAMKVGEYYRLENIPFFVYNIAFGDLVSVEDEEGVLYFEEVIKSSGHSTIQIIIMNGESATAVGAEFETLGCQWEENRDFSMIAIDVSTETDYLPVKKKLEDGEQTARWSYKESCLEHPS